MTAFKKINDKQFIFKDKNKVDKIFTIKDDIDFEIGGNIDFYSKETGSHLSRFSESDFKNFISERYNGDENLSDYIENWENFFDAE